MLLKCVREFTTRESGIPFTIMEGTVWFTIGFDIAPGGYELCVLEKIDGALPTGVTAKVRAEKIDIAETYFKIVPLKKCPEPVDSQSDGN